MQFACWKKSDNMGADRRCTTEKWLFGLYGLMMLWLLFFRRMGTPAGETGMNFVPLETMKRYLWVLKYSTAPVQRQWAGANLLGNVVLFFPLGIFLPRLIRKMRRFFLFILCVAACIVAVELCQCFTGLGACDVDDFILNFIGAMFGWLLWWIHQKTNGKMDK